MDLSRDNTRLVSYIRQGMSQVRIVYLLADQATSQKLSRLLDEVLHNILCYNIIWKQTTINEQFQLPIDRSISY